MKAMTQHAPHASGMRQRLRYRLHALIAAALFITPGLAQPLQAAHPLPSLAAARDGLTVSGISSGGYMAAQMHIAFSERIAGAAILAAGPYGCADGSALRAVGPCMGGSQPFWCAIPGFAVTAGCRPIVAQAIDRAERLSTAGRIAPLDRLAGHRVFLLAGERDTTVAPRVVEAARAFYARFGAQVEFALRPGMAHTFPTLARGGACDATGSPFIGACDFDGAGEVLKRLHPDLLPPEPGPLQGRLIEFDQRSFLDDAERARAAVADAGLDRTGFLYVPPDCRQGGCRVHVVFHGCLQGRESIGRRFAEEAGYNRWGETNRRLILYPQAVATGRLGGNPKGCWDWWGHVTPDYDTREGLQLKAVRRMIERLEEAIGPRAD